MDNTSIGNYTSNYNPIIAFDTIVDTDFGLIQYIYNNYLDESVFDKSKLERPTNDIIRTMYMREENNPLLSFVLPSISKEDADSLYNDFIDKKYNDILANSVGTSIQTLISSFNESNGEVKTTILCYNEEQAKFIRSLDEFKKNRVILPADITEKTYTKNNQYYFKYITDCYPIHKYFTRTNLYFSDCKRNLDILTNAESMDEDMRSFILKNSIRVFSMYD